MGIWLHSSLSFSIFWNVFLAPKTTYRKVLGDTVFPHDLRTQPGWQFHPADVLSGSGFHVSSPSKLFSPQRLFSGTLAEFCVPAGLRDTLQDRGQY